MHHGTFQLTTEAIDAPVRALELACAERQVETFRVLPFGDSAFV